MSAKVSPQGALVIVDISNLEMAVLNPNNPPNPSLCNNLRIASFNCRSVKNSVVELKNLCQNHDVICL